ncbi:hypothetical protein CEXT_344011 [Caerostris extrusa]|uniref:Secreted protein n=1 Tax=Caerostris extrusa TaxID=172846 RepID=A0AAV4Y1K1_CAEEX|nr:hypothetical protein CEXT_344011 [Caerostris extrusa]
MRNYVVVYVSSVVLFLGKEKKSQAMVKKWVIIETLLRCSVFGNGSIIFGGNVRRRRLEKNKTVQKITHQPTSPHFVLAFVMLADRRITEKLFSNLKSLETLR